MKSIKFLSNILFEQVIPNRVAAMKANPVTKPSTKLTSNVAAAPAITPEALAKEKADLALILNKGFENLSDWLKGMFSEDSASQWKPWKTWLSDNAAGAWTDFFLPQFKLDGEPILLELKKKITDLTAAVAAADTAPAGKYAGDANMVNLNNIMVANLAIVNSWIVKDGKLYKAFNNNNLSTDLYQWTINYSTGYKPISRVTYEIDADF